MRSRRAMVKISSQYGAISPLDEDEGVFYANMALKLRYSLADRRSAYAFAREMPCTDIRGIDIPMALHAAWYYDRTAADMSRLLQHSMDIFQRNAL